ncbi:MAG TPA: hypothetical protein VM095_01055 [Pyrinomonadaceae bacterium]|nr:hypothetical protein [Pyrinomonadaceae bacterium]
MESKNPISAESSDSDKGAESKDPRSDATSSETLSDVEETEKVGDTAENSTEEDDSSVPSPDGAFDEGRGSTNGIEDTGPM